MAITTEMSTQVTQLYVSLFDRAPERDGLGYWVQQMGAGASLVKIATDMFAVEPARVTYPNFLTNEQIVSAFYQNVLGRPADDEGKAYWTAKLNGSTPGAVVVDMIAAVVSYAGTDAAALASQSLFNNKVIAGLDYATVVLGTDVVKAAQVNDLVTAGPDGAAAAIAFAHGATEGNTFTLTNGTDIKTANVFEAGLVYTPGGDDRVNALQDEDQLTGVAAVSGAAPTLNATLGNANDNGGTIITPKLVGIEVVNVAFTGSGNNVTALDLQDATGVTAINITRVAQGKTEEVGNIKQAAATLSLANTNANQADTVEFSYAANVLKGSNTGSIALKDVDLGTLNIGQNASIATIAVNTNGFEHLTIDSTEAANTVRTINLPMDTGTDGSITITGDQSLTIATTTNVTNLGLAEAVTHAGGILQANGRLATIDASGMTGDAALTLTIAAGLLTTGKADTSGVVQDVTITGTGNADTFYLFDTVQAGDKIVGGGGTDTLVVYTGGVTTGTVSAVEALDIQLVGNVTMDMDKIVDATTVSIRNIDNTGGVAPTSADNGDWIATLNNLTAAQAAALSIQHSTTRNGDINDTTIQANLKVSTGTTDLVGVTITEGVNADPRFNFSVGTNADVAATVAVEKVESITLTDSDSESNTVELTNFADHTGTITLTGGTAGKFINLDVDTAAAPAENATGLDAAVLAAKVAYDSTASVANKAALEAAITAAAGVTGLNQVDVSGNAIDGFGRVDVAALATEVRLVAGVINAANEAADVTIRVGTTAANTNGGQTITMGAGNDTVIFDDIAVASGTRVNAGLTNADTVAGGAGNNTLVIDGNGVPIVLQQSEWDHVTGFQTIYLAGNGAGNVNTQQYFLQLDNDLIAANGVSGTMITISNDDGSTVSLVNNVDSRLSNNGARIDATSLSANTHFTYDGEEGSGATADRFVVNDQNTNGGNIIDGGDVSVQVGVISGVTRQLTGVVSADVLEVRNTATVTTADLAGVSNVGNIVINNDQAVQQTLNLTLNTSTIDALSDSGHTASLTEIETLTIRANDGLMTDAAGTVLATVAASRLVVDARDVTGAFALTITGDAGFAAADLITMKVNLGGAAQTVNLAAGAADTLAFSGTADNIVFAAATVTFRDTTGTSTQVFNVANTEILDFSAYVDTGAPAATIAYNVAVTGVTTLTAASATAGVSLIDTINTITTLIGGAGDDVLTGGTLTTSVTGGAGADTINVAASLGAVTTTGGAGADIITLTAGAVADTLVLNSLVGADTVNGYVVLDDSVQLSRSTFTALGVVGALAAGEFESGAGLVAATLAATRIIYNTTTGALFYDADGVGAGAGVQIATFVGAPVLVVGEFAIVA